MQNKYVGDIGDFGKYGLLREIFGRPEEPGTGCGLRLGVAWYLKEDDGGSDGNKTKYPKLKGCDSHLYDFLQDLVDSRKRRVSEVEQSNILPTNLYHSVPISSGTRIRWFKDALEATKDAAVVFVDPDNGIASPNTPVGSPKHVLPYELEQFYERGQSLIIYHHLARTDADNLINGLAEELQELLDLPYLPWALRYRRGTGRVYFIVAQEQHKSEIYGTLKEFEKKTCWFKKQPRFPHPHFKLVTSPKD